MKNVFVRYINLVVGLFFLIGCAGVSQNTGGKRLFNTSEKENMNDAASAITAVTGAVSDKPLSEEQLYNAARNMRNDPEAKSAVEAISSSFDKKGAVIKYSPATGKRYSPEMEYDPETGVKLLPVE